MIMIAQIARPPQRLRTTPLAGCDLCRLSEDRGLPCWERVRFMRVVFGSIFRDTSQGRQ